MKSTRRRLTWKKRGVFGKVILTRDMIPHVYLHTNTNRFEPQDARSIGEWLISAAGEAEKEAARRAAKEATR